MKQDDIIEAYQEQTGGAGNDTEYIKFKVVGLPMELLGHSDNTQSTQTKPQICI